MPPKKKPASLQRFVWKARDLKLVAPPPKEDAPASNPTGKEKQS